MKNNSYSSIALLGTSADPPTIGHKILLTELSKIFPKVVTWASDNPSKSHKTSLNQRYELLNTLVEAIALPNLELKQELSSKWAIKTLERAAKHWPNKGLILIIGSDLVTDIPHWFEAKNVLQHAQLGIVPREGWPIGNSNLEKIKEMGGTPILLPLKIPETASSTIHNHLLFSQIPKALLPILKKKNLYGLSQKM
ncbi:MULTISPECIES: nicotinate-nucleotide adenylyltransferase [Prochlorococcus]|uniref:nicotinate-nucleotide adenylyltransferase n=1 Tax=Prochlorococcus marinus (strain SARG / CCMP1375 / SS120) TaxID=167539 RepID=Q7VA69_PROMA|nr:MULTISPECIES: nicotinate-nucleotide adenylyltransferase [Prochlorococcus]AAQ00642.1 Nicotinic acid mononucleotide adenylyltransferase [Prochlorococcus marinus subsp. marinus str. CCMP1375]KGG10863.1 Nicotinate-nucleotide adenylyltransferase bacterial NadD family [Prochlorococcus marinus str. LG]KGG20443.1 Nicotinate-nucleotide adenylyltransferase bacterial NadD family [Prochlorococcus marinus str. SS2]KGG24112.1 Nicotinate-nucleotide adenylyltransferase bacterial NadD family [Prochlorococcus